MDDQALRRTYGNTDLPEGTEDRPLVTFAIFAYNQEKYIREAVEGAFSQTYSPLEIILSDDCSSDRTFEIIEEMAREYEGPHRIVVVRQARNHGLVCHLLNIARIANGKLFIVAAGDDISFPNRSEIILQKWIKTGATCINSKYDEIDESGFLIRTDLHFPFSRDAQRILADADSACRRDGMIVSAIGFCAAYDTNFWKKLPSPSSRLMIEDGLATCLLNLTGKKIETISEPLLAYRVHSSSLSLRNAGGGFQEFLLREKKIALRANEVIERTDYLRKILHPERDLRMQKRFRAIEEEEIFSKKIIEFLNGRFIYRIGALTRARSMRELRFYLPRLFGLRCLWALRLIFVHR